MKLDLDEYRKDLADLGLSRQQEDELLRTLWQIMTAFVDLGWGECYPQASFDTLQNRFSAKSGVGAIFISDHIAEPNKENALAQPPELGVS